jgi:L-2,4-diaminobutyric acid acetyltransferase
MILERIAIDASALIYEPPKPHHASQIDELAKTVPNIDANTNYFYHLWCRDFADTSIVSLHGAHVVSFIIGFVRPVRPDTLFIWQQVNNPAYKVVRLGQFTIDALMRLPGLAHVQYMESTITARNAAIKRVLARFAADRSAPMRRQPLFENGVNGFADHDNEYLYTIGPFGKER